MSLFDEQDDKNRTEFVTIRFTPKELAALQALAVKQDVSRAELIRNVALGLLEAQGAPSKELVEIVGVRILLLTLLKPLLLGKTLAPKSIEKVNIAARQMKKELATAIAAGEQE